jgi:hypothetical protein
MRLHMTFAWRLAFVFGLTCAGACAARPSADDVESEAQSASTDTPDSGCADAACSDVSQLPPTGSAAVIDTWLAAGYYKTWACEAAPHTARPPSGHSPNRVCSNSKASAHQTGEYPVGAASVKELYDDSRTRIVGYAVATKVATGGGEIWYWYERLDANGVIANGLGTSGVPKTVCTRCHNRAGTSTFGHDMVFTQVR